MGTQTGSLPTSVCCIPKRAPMRVGREAAAQRSSLFYVVFIIILLLFCISEKTGHISKNVHAKKEEKKEYISLDIFFLGVDAWWYLLSCQVASGPHLCCVGGFRSSDLAQSQPLPRGGTHKDPWGSKTYQHRPSLFSTVI